MTVNFEKLRLWRDVFTAYFKVISFIFLGISRKIMKMLSQQNYSNQAMTSTGYFSVFRPI
jgi:hypothetical protein